MYVKPKIRDGFNMPIRFPPVFKSQVFLRKLATGYYKDQMMTIQNHELYLYQNRYSKDELEVISLMPDVFIKSLG